MLTEGFRFSFSVYLIMLCMLCYVSEDSQTTVDMKYAGTF